MEPTKLRSKIDLAVVGMSNLINVVMVFLFAARVSGLPNVQYVLGVAAMIMGFALGYIAFLNRKMGRDKWLTFLHQFSCFSSLN